MITLKKAIWAPLLAPLIFSYFLMSHSTRQRISGDVRRWLKVWNKPSSTIVLNLLVVLRSKEFRAIYLHRMKCNSLVGSIYSNILSLFYTLPSGLIIYTKDIEQGLFIQHGIATIIAAKKIGQNAWINQQVTVGAGTKVLGDVIVGNNVVCGANAVVVKDVPDDCVVVGVPARIIRKNGTRTDEKL